ncbi:hypothetical protein O6H91_16G081600 [Diphasiastrum complanatum]|uniref:Uncharacterized protein n=1 Tax=Diphasiastrum complanatum TaxID=34168 RepID=A0ACC2BE24_DIPCM|nr:hypothetical protein O6H91_16G081600 [Diphasiastrum complanatum]
MRFFFFFSNELHLMNADATSMLQLLLPRSIASQIHTRLHNPLSITSSLPFRNQTVSHPRQCKSSSFKQCSCCFMFFPLNPFWCSNAAGFGFSHGALNSWIVEKQQKIKARLDGAFSVLDVYVLQELLPPFFIGLTAFTLLGLSFDFQRLMERNRNMESRKLQEKLHQRFALPCACIIFGLVGTLTSLILPHDQKKTGFGLTLAIIFGYYMVSVFCSLVGQLGVISPSLGVWIPNLAGVGSVLVVSSWLDHHEP